MMENGDAARCNPILEKAEDFAVRIVNLARHLQQKFHEHELSNQVKRSGTSIGANVIEAHSGSSKKDFLAKTYIAFKECNETCYWLRVLHRTKYIDDSQYDSIYSDAEELSKMLNAIIKTTKNNLESDKTNS